MINAVIFDIGMVLVYFRWKELFADLGFEGQKFEKIANATVHNPWWNEFDKGILSTEEIIDIFAEGGPQYRPFIEKIFEDPTKMIEQFPYAKGWIRDLKERGYQVYILSNWSKPAYDACKETALSFLPLVDGVVFSYKELVIKPDKEIYDIICSRYDIKPEEAVFLDDTEKNIIAAREFGLHGIHFQTYEQGKAELEALLAE